MEMHDLTSWLVNRGYDEKLVKEQVNRVNSIEREQLINGTVKKKVDSDQVTLILTYHPALRNTWKILKEAHQVLHLSPKLVTLFPRPPRIAFRNARSIRDELEYSSLKQDVEIVQKGNFSCGCSRCNICKNYLNTTIDTFKSNTTKKEYKIKGVV